MPARNGSGNSETRFSELDSLLGEFLEARELDSYFFIQPKF